MRISSLMTESYFLENSHRLLWVDTDNRQIISMKSRGFPQTPQDIMEKYNWCSVPQYTRYRRVEIKRAGIARVISACGCKSKAFEIEFCFLNYYYSSRPKLPFSQVLYTVEDEVYLLAMAKQGVSTDRPRT